MPDIEELARRIINDAKANEEVEVVASRSVETEIRIYEKEVESLTRAESKGVGIRVVMDNRVGFAHCGSFDEESIREALESARDNAKFATPDEFAGLADPDGIAATPLDLVDAEFHSASTEQKIALAKELEKMALLGDPRISKIESADYADVESEGFILSTKGIKSHTWATFAYVSASAVATQGEDTKTGGGYSVARGFGGIDLDKAATDVIKRATELLGASKPTSRRLVAVLDPRITATLMAIVGGSLSADAAQKGRSLFGNRLGEEVASGRFDLMDDPTEPLARGASEFDGEGLACRRNHLIKDGVLQTFLYDSYTARKENRASTASATRGYSSTPSPGPMALILRPGTKSQSEIISEITDGILIRSISGVHSGVNPISGDFSVGAEGFLIKNGQLASPFKEATISSTIQKMLMGTIEIGSDIEWLPGISAGPTIAIEEMNLSGV